MSSSGDRVSTAAGAAGEAVATGTSAAGDEADEADDEEPLAAALGALAGSSEQARTVVQARKANPMKPDRSRCNSLSSTRSRRDGPRRAAGEYPPGTGATNAPAPRVRRAAGFVALLALALVAAASPGRAVSPAREPIDLARYARLLTQHTRAVETLSGTIVDYAGLARSKDLAVLVAQVKAARPSRLGHHARLAFWINAYNLLTLDLVARHYPIESIKDIGSLFSPVWRMPLGEIEGVRITLDHIEHEILRKESEPRIHAAIVCASKSCPPLFRRPFRAATLEADLDLAMRRWLASRQKGVAIDQTGKTLRVSKIFDWFEDDFAAKGGVRATIAPYLAPADSAWLRGPGRSAPIQYFEYDWTLNDR